MNYKTIKLKALMEDLNLYGEDSDKEVKLTSEQKRAIMGMINDFNKYGQCLQREKSLTEIAKKLSTISKHAETMLTHEDGNWFDKNTIQRHAKELKKHTEDFVKVANEAHLLEQRMLALFDDLGSILNKYFEIADLPDVQIPTSVGGKGYSSADTGGKPPYRDGYENA